jgi:hypothetical protein
MRTINEFTSTVAAISQPGNAVSDYSADGGLSGSAIAYGRSADDDPVRSLPKITRPHRKCLLADAVLLS